MSNRSANYHDDMGDESLLQANQSSALVATMEPEDEPSIGTVERTGPCCEKCEAPLQCGVVAICRNCGWYASLGTFVEVDRDWELATQPESQAAEPAPRKSHLQVWLDMMPRWAWFILASALIVIVESVVARFVTPAGSRARTIWSLTQLGIGALAAAVCHVINFLALAADDAEIGVLDLVMKPVKLWIRAAAFLPTRLWVANTAASGLVAAVMSLVVIGGIPYERLWDWGFEEPPKQNLMGAVMDRVKELDSRNNSDNLEEAIGDFAGSQDLEGGELPKPKPEKPRSKVDCVILGYDVDGDGRLSSLLLGAAHQSRLVYIGHVTPKLSEEELDSLLGSLKRIHTRDPFIRIEAEATWVQPKYTCRISYGESLKGGRYRDLQWDNLLGTMKTP